VLNLSFFLQHYILIGSVGHFSMFAYNKLLINVSSCLIFAFNINLCYILFATLETLIQLIFFSEFSEQLEKGKPTERWGRKTKGLNLGRRDMTAWLPSWEKNCGLSIYPFGIFTKRLTATIPNYSSTQSTQFSLKSTKLVPFLFLNLRKRMLKNAIINCENFEVVC
jgi:hypothetical protein